MDEHMHGTTLESEAAFDMDETATLVCVCGFTGDSDDMLDHLIETGMDA